MKIVLVEKNASVYSVFLQKEPRALWVLISGLEIKNDPELNGAIPIQIKDMAFDKFKMLIGEK